MYEVKGIAVKRDGNWSEEFVLGAEYFKTIFGVLVYKLRSYFTLKKYLPKGKVFFIVHHYRK